MGLPDVVYLVKVSKRAEELRYSLRSLSMLPHGRVWIAGHKPKWVRNVGHIRTVQNKGKWRNQEINLQAACDHPDVAETFVMFNDDFFVMEPIDQVPVLHGGPLAALAAKRKSNGEWSKRIRATADYCGPDALAYDSIHVPMSFDKARLAEVLSAMPDGLLFRTVYGNLAEVGGTLGENAKISAKDKRLSGPFVSTSDGSFASKPVGNRIREAFPRKSRYER